MRLYHGSNELINGIDLSKGRKYKDFGQGFYTTHIMEQAVLWAKQISERYGGKPIVTEFEFDLEQARKDCINIMNFEHADKEWALFVMANRNREIDFKHNYDIVIGPVADDNMARLFGLYDMNIIDLEAVEAGLIYKDLSSQYFFASEVALKYIRKV